MSIATARFHDTYGLACSDHLRPASLQGRELFRRVDAGERPLAEQHLDAHAALDRAQLLESLGELQLSRRPRCKLLQQLATERVHTRVAQRRPAARRTRE